MRSHTIFIGTTLADNPTPQHFVALANELTLREHHVVILAPHRRVELENHEASPAIYIWPSERPTRLRDAGFLSSLISRRKPSCLIANFAAVNVMMTMGWLRRVPLRISWYHTISSQIDLDNPHGKTTTTLLRWRKRLVYGAATHVAANSLASARDVQSVFGVAESKCPIFHNSLADPVERFGLSPELPTAGRIVCVGRFFPSKGQDVLLRAMALISKKIPNARVEFIGEGPARDQCQALACQLGIQGKCEFSGQLPHTEVLKRMSTAVATVVPSRNEAFGLVNIESMALGIPVIASAVGGIPEIVRDGLDGFLVPPNSPEVLASKLKEILSNPHARREMRFNARQQFLSKFELSRAVRQQADWIESKLASIP